MRSDRVAARAATSNVAMNVRDKYQRAKFELDGLPAARSTIERPDRRNVLEEHPTSAKEAIRDTGSFT
jgi:hypothetical protein